MEVNGLRGYEKIKDLSEKYDIPETTLRELCNKDKVSATKFFNKWYIKEADLVEMFRRGGNAAFDAELINEMEAGNGRK